MSPPSGLRRFVGPPGPAPAGGAPSPAPPAQALPDPVQAALSTAPAPRDDAEEHCEFCATGIPSEHGHVADLEQFSLACACRACYLLFTQAVLARGDDPPLHSPGGLPPEPPAPESPAPAGTPLRGASPRGIARGDDPPEPPESPGSGRTPLRGASPRRGSARYRSVPDRYLRDSSRPMSAMEWDELQIPVGLAFFLASSERGLGGFYPSPAGATECTLDLAAWERLATAYPLLGVAEPDVEAVLLCRDSHASEAEYFIVPIDVCYELAGRMRMLWKGFDGGGEARASIDEFLTGVRTRAREAPASVAAQQDPNHG